MNSLCPGEPWDALKHLRAHGAGCPAWAQSMTTIIIAVLVLAVIGRACCRCCKNAGHNNMVVVTAVGLSLTTNCACCHSSQALIDIATVAISGNIN